MSRTRNTRIERNLHLPMKSYSPWSHVLSTISRNEMREHANYIFYYLIGKRAGALYTKSPVTSLRTVFCTFISLATSLSGLKVWWFDGSLVRWIVGSMDHWFDGSMVRWFDGSVVQWFAGSMDRWFDGSLVRWIVGSMVRWIGGSVIW